MLVQWTCRVAGTFFLALAVPFACTDLTAPRLGSPTDLEMIGGNGQSAPVGSLLPEPLRVRVTDAEERPVEGVEVRWATTGGSASPATSITDEDGTAESAWELGPEAGEQTAMASVESLPEVIFEANATAGAPASLVRKAGDGQTGVVGMPLPDSLVAVVVDVHGNPVAGVSVTWSVETDGGSVNPVSSTTAEDGTAATSWVLGTTSGSTSVRASIAEDQDVSFRATGEADEPEEVVKWQGDLQTGTAGAALRDSLVVHVTDQYGNPVGGRRVSWNVIEGDGSANPEESTTDGQGRASSAYILGTDGSENRMEAVVAGMEPVIFSASGTASPRRVVLFGDSNFDSGWEGRENTAVARSYLGSRHGGIALGPDDPHHPTQVAGKLEAEWLRQHGDSIVAVNHAIGGTATGSGRTWRSAPNAREEVGGLERFRAEVLGAGYVWNGGESGSGYPDGPIDRVQAFPPGPDDFALISIGTNDPGRGLTPSQTRDNIRWMIRQWKEAGLPRENLVITTLAPAPINGDSYSEINDLLRTLASEEGVGLIDLVEHVSDDNGVSWKNSTFHLEGDAVHYSEEVRQWIAEQMVTRIEEVIFNPEEVSPSAERH